VEEHYRCLCPFPQRPVACLTRVLTHWALRALQQIYRGGYYAYQKAGVTLMDLSPATMGQASLFGDCERQGRSERLMRLLDSINQKQGRGTLRLSAEGFEKSWRMRRVNLSPAYTTDWSELPVVKAA
jgi:DNA polymerase V